MLEGGGSEALLLQLRVLDALFSDGSFSESAVALKVRHLGRWRSRSVLEITGAVPTAAHQDRRAWPPSGRAHEEHPMLGSSSGVQDELRVGDAAILPAMLWTLLSIRALLLGVTAPVVGAQPSPHPATDEVGPAINLKIVKVLGLTIPTSLLPRADHGIE